METILDVMLQIVTTPKNEEIVRDLRAFRGTTKEVRELQTHHTDAAKDPNYPDIHRFIRVVDRESGEQTKGFADQPCKTNAPLP